MNGDRLAALQPSFRVYTLGELATLPPAHEDFVISDGVLTRGGKLLVFGKAGLGKTTLIDELALSLVTAKPFLGEFEVRQPYRVLIVQAELSEAELASHGQDLLARENSRFVRDNLLFLRPSSLKLPRQVDLLMRQIEILTPNIMILDPFYKFFDGESSDKPEEVGRVFDALDELQSAFNLDAIGIVHHENVGGRRPGGSWIFEGWPSTILHLQAAPGGARLVSFAKHRAPGADLPDLTIRRIGGELVVVGAKGGGTARGTGRSAEEDQQRVIKEVYATLKFAPDRRLTKTDLVRKTRLHAADLDAAVAAAPDLVTEQARPAGGIGRPVTWIARLT